jgi:hypothetical protein
MDASACMTYVLSKLKHYIWMHSMPTQATIMRILPLVYITLRFGCLTPWKHQMRFGRVHPNLASETSGGRDSKLCVYYIMGYVGVLVSMMKKVAKNVISWRLRYEV